MMEPAGIVDFRPTFETSESTYAADFLRRFAEIMAGGRNAGHLLQAADVIEALLNRVADVERQLLEEAQRCAAYRGLCMTADSAVSDLESRIAKLEQRLVAERTQNEAVQTGLTEQNRQLTARSEQAEAKLTETSQELLSLRAELTGLGDSLRLVPVATMRMARDQFQSLADDCAKSGNPIAVAMCEIGRSFMEQAIATGTPDTPNLDGNRPCNFPIFSATSSFP